MEDQETLRGGFLPGLILGGGVLPGSKSLCFRPNHAIFHTHFQASGPSKNHGWDGLSKRIEGVATPPFEKFTNLPISIPFQTEYKFKNPGSASE